MAIIDLFKIVDLKEKINERFGIKMHVIGFQDSLDAFILAMIPCYWEFKADL